jgi:lipid-binding SYLF domain-containing protein
MKTVLSIVALSLSAAAGLTLSGCSTAPSTEGEKHTLVTEADTSLAQFKRRDPGVASAVNSAYGYAVFPTIAKGGAGIGGAHGRGVVYEQGRMVGYCDMSQGTIGLQLGGQSFSELILFENKNALDRFKGGEWAMAAQATAVAAHSGAAATAKYSDGVMIFVDNEKGLMGEAAVGGQKFKYQPL